MTKKQPRLHIVPTTLRAANGWISLHHRHHGPAQGHRLSIAVADENGDVHGVAILGRPVSRCLDSAGYIEVRRVATDGTPNACSALYGASARVAREMGYAPHQVITYTLLSEPGTSLVAAGWCRDIVTAGGTWDTPSRARTDMHPTEPKVRWSAGPQTPDTKG